MAYGNIYQRIVAGIEEDAKLRIDALLGLPGAKEEYEKQRLGTAVATAGFEVG